MSRKSANGSTPSFCSIVDLKSLPGTCIWPTKGSGGSGTESTSSPANRGIALIVVLAAMAIVTALIGNAVQSALRARSEARQQRQLRQVELLVDAGVARAIRRLIENSEFQGEIWELAAGVCDRDPAQVEIKLNRQGDTVLVTIIARLSPRQLMEIQRSDTFEMSIPDTSHQETLDENPNDES